MTTEAIRPRERLQATGLCRSRLSSWRYRRIPAFSPGFIGARAPRAAAATALNSARERRWPSGVLAGRSQLAMVVPTQRATEGSADESPERLHPAPGPLPHDSAGAAVLLAAGALLRAAGRQDAGGRGGCMPGPGDSRRRPLCPFRLGSAAGGVGATGARAPLGAVREGRRLRQVVRPPLVGGGLGAWWGADQGDTQSTCAERAALLPGGVDV